MPRHVVHNPYAVRPVASRPGVGAKETATAGRSFADLLAEAESVRDAVRITAPAASLPGKKGALTASGLAAAVTVLWHGLGAGLPGTERWKRTHEGEDVSAAGHEG